MSNTAGQERIIYHFTERETFEAAKSIGYFKPRPFEKDGFIHCSTREQVLNVADFIAPKDADLVLLEIDTYKVTPEIIYENLEGGDRLFPHICGPLDLEAVRRAEGFGVNSEGKFELPEGY
jgi:uncharacterized protein (DUF952 family)